MNIIPALVIFASIIFTIFISCNLKNSSLEIRLLNILLLLLLSPLLSMGQVKNIQGRVLDRQSDEPVPFASVQFSLHRGGVLTDSSGMFIISLNNVLADDSLTITSVGYSPVKIPLSDLKDSSFITVPLKIEASKKEVVVKTSYNRALWFLKPVKRLPIKTCISIAVLL